MVVGTRVGQSYARNMVDALFRAAPGFDMKKRSVRVVDSSRTAIYSCTCHVFQSPTVAYKAPTSRGSLSVLRPRLFVSRFSEAPLSPLRIYDDMTPLRYISPHYQLSISGDPRLSANT